MKLQKYSNFYLPRILLLFILSSLNGCKEKKNNSSGPPTVPVRQISTCSIELNEFNVPRSCPCPSNQIYNSRTGLCINPNGSEVTENQCTSNQSFDSSRNLCVDNPPKAAKNDSLPLKCSQEKNNFGQPTNCDCSIDLFYNDSNGTCQSSHSFENDFDRAKLIILPNKIEKELIGEFYYYSFRINIDKIITIELSFNSQDYDHDMNFSLLDERKNVLAYKSLNRKNEKIEVTAKPGLFYIKVAKTAHHNTLPKYLLILSVKDAPEIDIDPGITQSILEDDFDRDILNSGINYCIDENDQLKSDLILYEQILGHVSACKLSDQEAKEYDILTKRSAPFFNRVYLSPYNPSITKRCILSLKKRYQKIKNINCKKIVRQTIFNHTTFMVEDIFQNYVEIREDFSFDQTLWNDALDSLNDWFNFANFDLYAPSNTHTQSLELGPLYLSPIVANNSSALMSVLWDRFKNIGKKDELLGNINFFDLLPSKENIISSVLTNSSTPPLFVLSILGSTLRSLFERAIYISDALDLQCRLKICSYAERDMKSHIYKTLNLFGLLANESKFKEAFKKIYDQRSMNSHLLTLFKVINDNYSNLKAALKSYTGLQNMSDVEEKLINLTPEKMHLLTWEFVNMLQISKIKIANFDKTGFYSGRRNDRLNFAFADKTLIKIRQLKDKLFLGLQNSIDSFKQNRISYAQELLSIQSEERIKMEYEQLKEANSLRLTQVVARIDALRKSIDSNSISLGVQGISLNDFMKSKEWENIYSQDQVPLLYKNLFITPLMGTKINPENSLLLRSFAINEDESIEVEKGDIINISVSGSWRPNCAIKRAGYREGPGGRSIDHAETGPEGFNIQYTSDSAFIESSSISHTESDYYDHGETESRCGKVEAWGGWNTGLLEGLLGFEGGTRATASYSKCNFTTEGRRSDTSNTSGNNSSNSSRATATFSSGIRLIDTPFTQMPAGALLLVSVPSTGSTRSSYQDVHVVQRNFTLIAPKKGLYYFVVNDCYENLDDRGSLSLNMTIKRPLAEIATDLSKAMTDGIEAIKSSAETFTKMGSLSSNDINILRSSLRAKFLQDTKYPVDQFHTLSQFFNFWIDKELAILDRKVQISNLIREMDQLTMSLTHNDLMIGIVDKDTENVTNSSSFESIIGKMEQIGVFILDNFDIVSLGHDLTTMMNFSNSTYLPILQFMHYDIMTKLINDPNYNLGKIDLDTELSKIADGLLRMFKAVDTEIDNNEVNSPTELGFFENNIYTLTFPNPHSIYTVKTLADSIYDEISSFPMADALRSNLVWKAIKSGKNFQYVNIEVGLDDLYFNKKSLLHNSLNCDYTNVIVDSFAIYFILDDINYTRDSRTTSHLKSVISNSVDIKFNGEVKYPTPQGLTEYKITNTNWTEPKINLFFGYSDEWANFTDNFKNGISGSGYSGQGISPFTTFRMDLGSLFASKDLQNYYVPQIKEMRLLFKVKYRDNKFPLTYIPSCFDTVSPDDIYK